MTHRIRVPEKPLAGKSASWITNNNPTEVIVIGKYGTKMTRLRKSAYEKTKQMLQRLSLEEQQRLRDTVSNRPRTSHVCSTLIQFFILFFHQIPPRKKIGRPGYATEEERRKATLQKHRRYNDKRKVGGGGKQTEEGSAK